jgi:hypothetical protein
MFLRHPLCPPSSIKPLSPGEIPLFICSKVTSAEARVFEVENWKYTIHFQRKLLVHSWEITLPLVQKGCFWGQVQLLSSYPHPPTFFFSDRFRVREMDMKTLPLLLMISKGGICFLSDHMTCSPTRELIWYSKNFRLSQWGGSFCTHLVTWWPTEIVCPL